MLGKGAAVGAAVIVMVIVEAHGALGAAEAQHALKQGADGAGGLALF